MIIEAIKKASKRENLEYETMREVIDEIASGKTTDAQVAAFLTAMRMKGETVEEITAAATVMREKCTRVDLEQIDAIDIVGTGGDGASTFNISTAAAFVVAAGGIGVAKHGSRSASGKVGSADLLEAMGVNIFTVASQEKKIFDKTGMCFMLAPNHHPSMKYVTRARSEIKIRTFFNILGPLVNPANAKMQLLGVFEEDLVQPMARVMANLGIKDGMTVHGLDGLDEATICAQSLVCEVRDGKLKTYRINPLDFGLPLYEPQSLKSETKEENVSIIRGIFSGTIEGAKKDIVLLNSALAFYITRKTPTIGEGIEYARKVIDSKRALYKLDSFIKATNGDL